MPVSFVGVSVTNLLLPGSVLGGVAGILSSHSIASQGNAGIMDPFYPDGTVTVVLGGSSEWDFSCAFMRASPLSHHLVPSFSVRIHSCHRETASSSVGSGLCSTCVLLAWLHLAMRYAQVLSIQSSIVDSLQMVVSLLQMTKTLCSLFVTVFREPTLRRDDHLAAMLKSIDDMGLDINSSDIELTSRLNDDDKCDDAEDGDVDDVYLYQSLFGVDELVDGAICRVPSEHDTMNMMIESLFWDGFGNAIVPPSQSGDEEGDDDDDDNSDVDLHPPLETRNELRAALHALEDVPITEFTRLDEFAGDALVDTSSLSFNENSVF
ncbi:Hypothetical protein, putative [Bodo saltans]|uniref:Transmembrane protein n=1 Tax=Bodo saltans TaxID=75058 RepID=A0A0S4J5J4_BODSA|nr:Hypothetical protein, putative [Bodo saltans]|eukprot:CUG83740.1 Hypothetical protein, putative [Bodo saltans]